jgi:hypothetical protein
LLPYEVLFGLPMLVLLYGLTPPTLERHLMNRGKTVVLGRSGRRPGGGAPVFADPQHQPGSQLRVRPNWFLVALGSSA